MENLLVLRIKLIFICICISFASQLAVVLVVRSLIPSLCHLLLNLLEMCLHFYLSRPLAEAVAETRPVQVRHEQWIREQQRVAWTTPVQVIKLEKYQIKISINPPHECDWYYTRPLTHAHSHAHSQFIRLKLSASGQCFESLRTVAYFRASSYELHFRSHFKEREYKILTLFKLFATFNEPTKDNDLVIYIVFAYYN